jgi:uncharacterized protein YkwD
MVAKARLLTIAAVAAGLLLGAPGSAGAAFACPNSSVAAADLSNEQMESALFCLVNQRRAGAGRRPVQGDGMLHRAAVRYATTMVGAGFFSHHGADGSTIIRRLRAVGYVRPGWLWMVGENLIWATGDLSTPESMVTAWMESPEHRANLLYPGFREMGMGAVHGTPEDPADPTGVTVASEYGARQR